MRKSIYKVVHGITRGFKQTDYKRSQDKKYRPIDGWDCQYCVGKSNVNYANKRYWKIRNLSLLLGQAAE